MEYAIITYIATIIISIIIKLTNDLNLFKDIFNIGYKFNIKNFSKIKKEVKTIFPNKNIFLSLIPIYNLMTNLSSSIMYEDNKYKLPEHLNHLEEKNILVKMSKDKITKYKKHPNILNTIYISSKTTIQDPIQTKIESESTPSLVETTFQTQSNKYSYTTNQESNISSKKQFLIYLLSELLTEQDIEKLKETKKLAKERDLKKQKRTN